MSSEQGERDRHLLRTLQPSSEGPLSRWKLREWLLALALAAASLLTYGSVSTCEFVNYDDGVYVASNSHVRGGLAWDEITWALTTFRHGNWHPLVWWSFLVDAQLFRHHAGGFHLTNLLWHTGSVLLLFSALRRMTGQTWPSAVTAALFAVHPLNVEAVAWVSERKGVISTFFWMLTLWCHARYAESPSPTRYAWVVGAMVLGLMAKPMLVTLPCVLLLLDCWPLRRLQMTWALPAAAPGGGELGVPRLQPVSPGRLVLEKVPLLLVAAVFSVLAVKAQGQLGALPSLEEVSGPMRVKNTLVSYVWYLKSAIHPSGLAVFYPHPGSSIPAGQLIAAVGILAGITVLTVVMARWRLYPLVGWLWYLGTLVPVCGLVQVGLTARADRYGYVPLVGIFMVLGWGACELAQRLRCPRLVAGGVALVLLYFIGIARQQVHYWHDSVSLWEHALAVTEGNFLAHNNLGYVLLRGGQQREAQRHLGEAVRLRPSLTHPRVTLAELLHQQGQDPEAIPLLRDALKIEPGNIAVRQLLLAALLKQGQEEESISLLEEALGLFPSHGPAHRALGMILLRRGRPADALPHLQQALPDAPGEAMAHYQLGLVHLRLGNWREAAGSFQHAAGLQPGQAPLHRYPACPLYPLGKWLGLVAGSRNRFELADKTR